MAIQTIDGFEIKAPVSIDNRYGPFVDEAEANTAILIFYRYIGLTVLITGSGEQEEYWYNPTIADQDLVPKVGGASLSGTDTEILFFSSSTAISGSSDFTFNYATQSLRHGYQVQASGIYSHAAGNATEARGAYSYAGGSHTVTSGSAQTVVGQYNAISTSQSAFIVGDGYFDGFSIVRHNVLFVSKSHFEVSASNTFLQGLPTSPQANILAYNTASGQVYYTASNAIGGVTRIIAGANITIDPPGVGTGEVTINASPVAGTGLGISATASFNNLTTWNFTHNLNTRYVAVQAFDINHQQIIPEVVELIDTSSARLTFPTLESGYVLATVGGATASLAIEAISVFANNGGQIYGLDSDLVIQPIGNLVISGSMIPGPPYTDNTSSFNLGSPTAAWNHLYVANGSIVFVTGSNTADLSYTGTHIAATKPFTGSLSGSLFGTASWAQSASQAVSASRAVSSSFATTASFITASNVFGPFGSNSVLSASLSHTSSFITASNVFGPFGSNSVLSASLSHTSSFITASNVFGPFDSNSVTSASYASSSTNALTASYVNPLNQNVIITGSLYLSGSLLLPSGSDEPTGTVALDGGSPGTATVSNNLVTVNSLIFLTKQTNNHLNAGPVVISNKTNGSFTITSNHNNDTDIVAYLIINSI